MLSQAAPCGVPFDQAGGYLLFIILTVEFGAEKDQAEQAGQQDSRLCSIKDQHLPLMLNSVRESIGNAGCTQRHSGNPGFAEDRQQFLVWIGSVYL